MSSTDETLSTATATIPSDLPQSRSSNVTGRDLLVVFFVTLFAYAALVGAAIGVLLLYSDIPFDEKSPWVALLLLAPVNPILLGTVWLRMRGRWATAAQWGLGQFRWVYLPVGLAVASAFVGLSELVDPSNFELKLKIYGDLPAALVFGFLAAGCAPFVEELVFRGMVYRWLTQRFSVWLSAILSALIFAVFHAGGGWILIGFIALHGVAYAGLFQITKTLWPGIIAHATNNFISVLARYLGW
jgi:membrane protease YdiL (CAAX protease family)